MITTLKNSFKTPEIRNKILWTLFFVLIYRIGCFVPVPGINVSTMASVAGGDTTSIFGIMNMMNGGAVAQGALFAIGISPYINASIIVQLLTVAIPRMQEWSKEGEAGREKINKVTRYMTLGLAVLQSVGILLSIQASSNAETELFNTNLFGLGANTTPTWLLFIMVTAILTAGAFLCMWIGERITEKGVSNGISMLIFVGIVATAANSIFNMIVDIVNNGFIAAEGWKLIVFLGVLVIIFAFVVFVDGGERKIPVQYAKQVKGNKSYGGQSSIIPIKVNASGVLPLIFAYALLSLPSIIASTFWPSTPFANWITQEFQGAGGSFQWLYSIILAGLIFAFAYFYSSITFNPFDISKNLQQNGGFIPGIRPGKNTGEYLQKVVKRITLYGATFLAIMALVPTFIFGLIGGTSVNQSSGNAVSNLLINSFSATGMLIVVSVALEFEKALQQQLMLRHYKGFLK